MKKIFVIKIDEDIWKKIVSNIKAKGEYEKYLSTYGLWRYILTEQLPVFKILPLDFLNVLEIQLDNIPSEIIKKKIEEYQ